MAVHPFDTNHPIYIVETKYQHEKLALSNLTQQNFRVWPGQSDSVNSFLRYVLIQPNSPNQSLSTVKTTPGVTGLLKIGKKLAVIFTSSLDNIITQHSSNLIDAQKIVLSILAASQKDTLSSGN